MTHVKNIEELSKATKEGLVLVDFYAEWCGPCKMMDKVLGDLAIQYPYDLKIIKVDTEVAKELVEEFQIMSIPTIKLFHDGEMINTFNGFVPKGKIINSFPRHHI